MVTPTEQRRGSILVVDDDESVLGTLRITLRREGYDVTATADPLAALRLLEEREFAVVLTDQQMPRITGLELLARSRQVRPESTRILMTGVPNLDMVVNAVNQGEIYRFIVKPWIREELLATVENGCQRYALLCRSQRLQAETESAQRTQAEQMARIAEQNHQLESLNLALSRNLEQSVQLCLKTLDAFCPVLGNQALRVRELCRAMAETLNLPRESRQILDIAASLHDIGLIGVPRSIIRKWRETPEALTERDWERIRHHPTFGQELVGFAENLQDVGETIRTHHERHDGAGYPDRRKGDAVPNLARYLAVAVAYATYRREESALDFVRANSGTAFDPEAVHVLVRSLPLATLPRRRREVLLRELRPGMVLAQGVYSSSGALVVPEGEALSESYIARLRGLDRDDVPAGPLVVYG